MLKCQVCCVLAIALIGSSWVQASPHIVNRKKTTVQSGESFAVPKCPENEVLNNRGKTCEPTCENPIRRDVCQNQKVFACECEEGYVRNIVGRCIKLEECPHILPQKMDNTLSRLLLNRHNERMVNVSEPNADKLHDNDPVSKSEVVKREAPGDYESVMEMFRAYYDTYDEFSESNKKDGEEVEDGPSEMMQEQWGW